MDGGPGRQAKACQLRRGQGLTGAHRRQHAKQECCDKILTLQLHVSRGHTAQGSCRVEEERDNTSRGSNNGNMPGQKRRQQHHLRVVRPRTHPEEVIPEKSQCYRAVQARNTLAFKQQMLNAAPTVLPSRLSPRSRTKTRTRGEDVIVVETARCSNSCDPKVETMIPGQVRRTQGHNWVHNRR